MLKTWHKVVLASLAISAGLFALSFSFPAAYEICGPNEYSHVKECAEYHLGPFVILWIITTVDAHNGLVTAIATVFVAGFTWTLWRLGTNESRAVHRPRIIVRDVRQLGCNPGDPIAIQFRIINAGASNARIVASRFETGFFDGIESYKASESPETGSTNWIGNKTLRPNGLLNLVHPEGKWRAEHFHAFTEMDKGFFFGGKIIYRDDIGNTRRVGIFRRLDVASRRFRPVDDPDYEYED